MSSGIALSDNKNPERVAAGLKATINNPTVSQESKDRARGRLDQMGVEVDVPASTQRAKETIDTYDDADYGQVLDDEDEALLKNKRGLAADTRGAYEPGQYAGMDTGENDDFGNEGRSRGFHGGQAGENREMGGYKATLKNPIVSDEAKQNAKRVLKDNDQL